jgi:hypothetical protein
MLRSFQWWYRTCQRVHSESYEVIYFHIIFVRNMTGRRREYSHGSRCSGAFCKHGNELPFSIRGRLRLKCDDTLAETRFRLPAKRTSPFKSAGAKVQSTTGSQDVRISGCNAGYTMFRGSVNGTGYPLHSPVSLHSPPPTLRHRVPSHFNWTLQNFLGRRSTMGRPTKKSTSWSWLR